ncbi:MAG TPA: PTS mannose/fructose/sorbose transporter subunit IIB [Caldithrix abyssi]|uniref:PTS mannose/fructose/sorbose transporter subunit IIB n=1 Tax=Caldithrix abyssi TaxID=187145 RepID=A0A7V4WU95_CALAY|nr:PTS mannose/fructose/sorbose transporter subunit IIB [Caldithrix abyssi]
MGVQLFRIDDRLIHGQVVLGWANYLKSTRVILCDNMVRENDWERELYLSVVPEYLVCNVFNTEETSHFIQDHPVEVEKAILVVNSPVIIEELLDKGLNQDVVNVGGIHFKQGRKKYLPYLFLNEEEVSSFRRCMTRGVQFECQDMPNSKKLPLEDVIK